MSFEIMNRWTRVVVYSSATAKDLGEAALEALKARADLTRANLADANLARANLARADLTRANLTRADLTRANLTRADLTRADLTRADLTRANLTDANLADANLTDANLAGADLTRANLTDANLAGADLTRANLTGADLTRADLTRANLRDANLADANLTDANLARANLTDANLAGADLTRANLTPIRDDFWAVLCASPKEAFGLRRALVEGRINGSAYQGECACLVGTLANVRGCSYEEIPGLAPNGGRPAERFFLAIQPGDTPEKSQHAKLAVEWLDDWAARMRGAFTPDTQPEM